MKPPTAAESVLLSNAVLTIILDVSHQATKSNGEQHLFEYRRLSSDSSTSTPPPTVPHLIDAMLYLASQSPPAADLALPSNCIETAIEAATNAECDGILSFLDTRLAEFRRSGVMQKSHHTLLRTCTLLLKRLSKSQNASLCGRVLLFLAKFLPLTERSGVNLGGAFHVDNVTPVEQVSPDDDGCVVDAEGKPVDVAFYTTFWALQKWFSDPPRALASGQWSEIARGVRAVLDKFAAEKVTITENSGAQSTTTTTTTTPTAAAGATTVKYLSSARLLPLQLRDASFRRHFLIQALVLMAWVEHPLLKDWAEKGAKGRTLEDLVELRSRVFRALEGIPEKGHQFTDAIRGVLRGEEAWSTWKQAGCPSAPLQVAPLQPPPAAATATIGPPQKRPRPSPDATFGVRVGTEELDRLWNLTEDNVNMLGADDRGGFKTLRQLMEPVIEEMNDDADGDGDGGGDDSMRASKNSAYSWKTLRLVARDSLPAFAASVRAGGDLAVAARVLYPDEVPAAAVAAAADVAVEGEKDAEKGGEVLQVSSSSPRPETPVDVKAMSGGGGGGDDDDDDTHDDDARRGGGGRSIKADVDVEMSEQRHHHHSRDEGDDDDGDAPM